MSSQKPNILLITTDQQRHDTVGSLAPSFLRTPHMDHLRREGVEFSSAYAECPICVPSRVSIMNGKSPLSTGFSYNGESSQWLDRESTLPALLGRCGYQTAAIGKMHFSPQRARHGFEEMILPQDYFDEMAATGTRGTMAHGLGQNELYPGMATVPEAQTLTAWIAEKSLNYILSRRDPTVPFFLWTSFSKPHPPFDPPEPYYSMYRNCDIPEPVVGDWAGDDRCPETIKRFRQKNSYDLIPAEVIREARAAYYGLITQVDYNMGRIFAALQDRDLFENTLILLTSDHGEFLGDHLCGSKRFFHEASAHIPFYLRMPDMWSDRCCGGRVGSPVTHSDILPTLLRAAEGDVPDDSDGQDLIALARGDLENPRRNVEGVFGFPFNAEGVEYLGITDGKWKYMWYFEGGAEQLFNIEEDPREVHDLSGENPAKCAELHSLLVERDRGRGGRFSDGRRLLKRDVKITTETDRRSSSWPGYHTEFTDSDVRH